MDMCTVLSLQISWGADEALDGAPTDRTFRKMAVVGPVSSVRPVQAQQVGARLLADHAIECARSAATTEALRAVMADFDACSLSATATHLVFSDGNPHAGLVLVDNTPGQEEDLTGRPMAGPPGQLLDRMLASIGLDRKSLLIINLIPWRPPGGRPATEMEVSLCLPFLRRHLALLKPRIIVSLGAAPAQALSGKDGTIRRLRGKWQTITLDGMAGSVPMLPITHPSNLLRIPEAKQEAWTDLLSLNQALKNEASDAGLSHESRLV